MQGLIGQTVDLGWPHGSLRYELWHQFRRPRVELDVDVVHAPSLAIPAVRDLPLVVTVHDVAFLREPEAFTRRGLTFHRRGLEIAHREAAAIITASRFARDELIDVGFDRDRIHLAPHGVETRVPESAAQMRGAPAGLGLDRPFVVAVGTIEPRKGLDTLAQALVVARRSEPDLELADRRPGGVAGGPRARRARASTGSAPSTSARSTPCTATPSRARCRPATRGSASPRSRRWHAAAR